MVDTKISGLTPITSADSGDKLEILDVSDTTFGAFGTNKSITRDNFLGTALVQTTSPFTTAKDTKLTALPLITSLTALTTPEGTDKIVTLDVSDTTDGASGTNKSITRDNFLGTALVQTTSPFTTAKDTKLTALPLITSLTALTTPEGTDKIVTLDVSDTTDGASGTNKSITRDNFLGTALVQTTSPFTTAKDTKLTALPLITSLTALTTPEGTDKIVTLDVSDTTDGASGTNKSITRDNFLGTALVQTTSPFTTAKDTKLTALPLITSLTALTTPEGTDKIVTLDVSDTTDGASGTNKSITRDNFLGTALVQTTSPFTTAKDVKLTGLQKSISNVNPAENSGLYLRLTQTKIITGTAGTQVGAANRIIISPYISPFDMIVKKFALNVTTLSTVTNQYSICIYSDLNGIPNTFLFESDNILADATGLKETINGYTFLAGVPYWLGVRSELSGTLSSQTAGNCMDLPSIAPPGATIGTINKAILKGVPGVFSTPLSTSLPIWTYSSAEYVSTPPYVINAKF